MKIKLALSFALLIMSHLIQANDRCKATYDQMNVTHQNVSSMDEYYFCFGYHHGTDRAWEMDYFRRSGQGRNAEVLGFEQLKQDLMMRLVDLPSRAAPLYAQLSEQKKKFLELYSQGVNEGFKIGKNVKEFKDKGYEPEAWMPEHTILVLLLQSFDQTRKTFFRDYEEEKYRETWGADTERLFSEEGMPWENTILKKGEYPKSDRKKTTSISKPHKKLNLWAEFPTVFGKESGSNNWVISKKKSKSGYAILANDPHLDLKTPLFLYWIHMKSPKVDAIGATVPGVPVIVSGTNGKVAWGLTNAYINTADAVFLKDVPDDFIESFRPNVKIKWGFMKLPFFLKSFERTKTGLPILPLELNDKRKMVMVWTGFHLKAEDIEPMFELVNVQNVDDMNGVLKRVGLPAWNFVFADTKGDIGYRVIGKVYRHKDIIPYGVAAMKTTAIDKNEFLELDERPHVLRPARNYIYTANNRHWPMDAKFYGGRGYSYSFRGFRIDELLQGQQDVNGTKYIQCDRQAVDARFFVEKILRFIDSPELKAWDFNTKEDSIAPAIYRRMIDIMMEEWKVNEYALFRVLDTPVSHKQKEMKGFYKRAIKEIKNRKWGEIHRLHFPHLSRESEWVFSPEIPGLGDNHSVDPGTANWSNDTKIYEQFSGASMRMIIEMKPRPEIVLSLPGLNRDYQLETKSTPWQDWRECKYQTVKY
jgi:penicillin amidase